MQLLIGMAGLEPATSCSQNKMLHSDFSLKLIIY